ncbi:hypothetical protein VTI28DRAFT_10448 [Corynascus sepedonium]
MKNKRENHRALRLACRPSKCGAFIILNRGGSRKPPEFRAPRSPGQDQKTPSTTEETSVRAIPRSGTRQPGVPDAQHSPDGDRWRDTQKKETSVSIPTHSTSCTASSTARMIPKSVRQKGQCHTCRHDCRRRKVIGPPSSKTNSREPRIELGRASPDWRLLLESGIFAAKMQERGSIEGPGGCQVVGGRA